MFTGAQVVVLLSIAGLGHVMAALWRFASRKQWKLCRRAIYDLPIGSAQVGRELRNSAHAPIHSAVLGTFLTGGFFENSSLASFFATALVATIWAEIWHYGSHRAFHTRALHWIHREHHLSAVCSPYTAISFSLLEKLIFDIGYLAPLSVVDRLVSMNFYGIAGWYLGYLVINSYSHANFEMKPSAFNRVWGRLLTTTTYHALHHSRYTGNYGLGTRALDRLFGTEWEDYEPLFDQVARQGRPLKRLRERVTAAGGA